KGLHAAGVDLIVTPYRGKAIESPWWRTAQNPLYREAELFAGARGLAARLRGDTLLRRAEDHPEDRVGDRLTREAIWRYVTPRGGDLLGRRPGAVCASSGREGRGRLLLRLRRQVPAGVDAGPRRRTEPRRPRARLRPRRRRLPRGRRHRAARRRRALQRLPAG